MFSLATIEFGIGQSISYQLVNACGQTDRTNFDQTIAIIIIIKYSSSAFSINKAFNGCSSDPMLCLIPKNHLKYWYCKLHK